MNLGKYFSIGQEFYKEEPTPLEISLFLDTDEEVVFYNKGRSLPEARNLVQTKIQDHDVVRTLWLFKGMDSNNRMYDFGVDNLDGTLRFMSDTVPGTTAGYPSLRSTNNIKYKGYVINGNTWYRGYDGPGLERVTTAERIAILSECPEGYEVIDTDLNQKFNKVDCAWV